jgi:hypothetical protein
MAGRPLRPRPAPPRRSFLLVHLGNSKYWFRRVGTHPVFEPLRKAAAELAGPEPERAAAFLATQARWDPFAFVDLCEAAVWGRAGCEELCRRIQQAEWRLLFDYCYRQAVQT